MKKQEMLYTVSNNSLNKMLLSLFGGLSLALSVFMAVTQDIGPITVRVAAALFFVAVAVYFVTYAFKTVKVYTNDTIEIRKFLFFKRTYAMTEFKKVKVKVKMSPLENSLEEFIFYKFYRKKGLCVFVLEGDAVNAGRLFMAITARGAKIVK